MKVTIHQPNASGMNLRIPTGLALNRVSAHFLRSFLKKHGVRFTRQQTSAFLKELNRYRRSHPDWVLVEVQSADGEYIQVTL